AAVRWARRPGRSCFGSVLRRRLHLGEERLRALLQLLWRQVLDMLGEPPVVPERIFEAPGAITPELVAEWHDRLGAGIDRPLPSRIHMLPVHEEAHRRATVRV